MAQSSLIRDYSPRTQMKLHRNHFTDSRQNPLSAALIDFSDFHVGSILQRQKSISASVRASERMQNYRYAIVNAIFNPRKVILGDDPIDAAQRDWL